MKICGFLQTTLLDFPDHLACTIFTGGCDFRCPFCHNSELLDINAPALYTEQEVFDFLKKRQHIIDGVAITGGEPTLQADLEDFIRHIKENYGLLIKLDTNGSNPKIIEKLIEENLLDYIAMDIKTALNNYPKVCGINLSTEELGKIKQSVEIIKNSKIDYEFRTTVTGGLNEEKDFEGIGQLIKGAKHYFLQCYKDNENVLEKNIKFHSPSKEELLKYADIVRPYVDIVELRGI